jgi:hypothetical protein
LFVPATSGGKTVETLQRRSRKYNPDGTRRPSLIKRITKLNKVATPSTPLTPEMADVVRESLRDDLALLSRLLDRDLGFWFDEAGS